MYANSLPNALVYDDLPVIVDNAAARDPLAVARIFLSSSWSADVDPSLAYRPLTTWSFAVDHATHGTHPFGYHLVNVAGHAAVSVLVTLLARTVGLSLPTAALAGLLFAVHPVHTEVVANGVGRAEILAALFSLLALLGQRIAGRRVVVGSVLALGSYVLALLAKENSVALLVLLPLSDLLFADDGDPRRFVARLRGARAVVYLGAALVTVAYLALRTTAVGSVMGGGPGGVGQVPFWQNAAASQPTVLRIATALAVLAHAVWLLFVPMRLSADYSYAHLVPAASLVEPRVLVGFCVAAALVAGAILLRRRRAAFFWLALSVCAWGVVSNVPFAIGTIFGERLLYLPSVGFCALLAMALDLPARGSRRYVAGTIAAALVVAWGARTVARNGIWRDGTSMAEATVADAPDSGHAHAILGRVRLETGRTREAVDEFERALAICPDDVDTLFNLGAIRMQRGEYGAALGLFERVVALQPRHYASWVDTAAIRSTQGDFAGALDAADRAVAIRPGAPSGHVMRGFALRSLARFADAHASFERALALPDAQPDALFGLAATALDLGDLRAAQGGFERLVRVAPTADAYRGLVESYRRAGRLPDADRAAAVARARFPGDPYFAR